MGYLTDPHFWSLLDRLRAKMSAPQLANVLCGPTQCVYQRGGSRMKSSQVLLWKILSLSRINNFFSLIILKLNIFTTIKQNLVRLD